jgi:hypothetical protein
MGGRIGSIQQGQDNNKQGHSFCNDLPDALSLNLFYGAPLMRFAVIMAFDAVAHDELAVWSYVPPTSSMSPV